MAKTCVEMFEEIWKLVKFCSAYCGANVTTPNYRMNLLTWFLVIAIKIFFFLTGYTVYVSVVLEGDWIGMVQSLCTLGNGLQGYVKLINCIYSADNIRLSYEELYEIYKAYEVKSGSYKSCLRESIHVVSKAMRYIFVVYLTTIVFIFVCPAFYYLMYGERILVLQFYFPGIDHRSTLGYVSLTAMHVMCVLFAGFGNYSTDMYLFIPMSHASMMKDILVCKFQDLNELLLEVPVDREKTRQAFRDILQWHQKYMNYIQRFKTTFFWVITVVIVTNSLSTVLALFCIVTGEWPGAYAYLILCIVMLYVYCKLGTMVEVAIDGFIDACYANVDWYLLQPTDVRMLSFMLLMAQNISGIMVAGVVPLTMNTGLQIAKAIYSYTMMLFRYLE